MSGLRQGNHKDIHRQRSFNIKNVFYDLGLMQRTYPCINANSFCIFYYRNVRNKKVQVGKDQEKAQSEKDSHSKNRGGKKPN